MGTPTQEMQTPIDSEQRAASGEKRKLQRVLAVHALPSERFSLDSHLKILKNAVIRTRFGEQAIDTEVLESGLRKQSASLNVTFLVEVGLLQKDKRQYTPTSECVRFVKLLNIDEAKARPVLNGILQKTWFVRNVRTKLELEKEASAETLIKELALEAEVSDFQAKKRAFEVLLEYMSWAGTIRADGDTYRLGDITSEPSDAVQETAQESEPRLDSSPLQPLVPPTPTTPAATGKGTKIYRGWPGVYDLWLVPDPKAVKIVEAALREIKTALEIQQEEGA